MYNLYNYEKFEGDLLLFDIQQIASLACLCACVPSSNISIIFIVNSKNLPLSSKQNC